MKRSVLALLLAVLLLTGCGAESGPPAGEMDLPESEDQVETEQNGTPVFLLKPEWSEYDPNVERIWFTIENQSGAEIMTGVDYRLETLFENGEWKLVRFKDNAAWEAIGLSVQDGGTLALSCSLSAFDYDFSGGGTYRIVKSIGDEVCAGEFKLAKGAAVSRETPYGYAPLEALPEDYSPIQRMNGGPDGIDPEAGVIFDGQGAYGVERVADFLEKVRLGIPCQLRTFQDYGEGAVMAIDVIYENHHFLWRMRQEDTVTEQRFSYIVTDGETLYLSNGADWESTLDYDSNKAFLVPEGECGGLIPGVEQDMANRLEWNATRYQVWDEAGVWCAGVSDAAFKGPTEFFVTWQEEGKGSRGAAYDLQDWDGLETAITALEWQESGALKLTCDTLEGEASVLYFDPETETLEANE